MYIPNDDTQNYPISRLQLVAETFRHLTHSNEPTNKFSTNKKTLL